MLTLKTRASTRFQWYGSTERRLCGSIDNVPLQLLLEPVRGMFHKFSNQKNVLIPSTQDTYALGFRSAAGSAKGVLGATWVVAAFALQHQQSGGSREQQLPKKFRQRCNWWKVNPWPNMTCLPHMALEWSLSGRSIARIIIEMVRWSKDHKTWQVMS